MPTAPNVLMAVGVLLCGFYSAQVTEHRMRKYGIGVEMSRITVWLAENLGIDMAIALGVALPLMTLVAVATTRNWSGILGILLGYELLHAKFQYLSLKFEPEIDRVRAESTA